MQNRRQQAARDFLCSSLALPGRENTLVALATPALVVVLTRPGAIAAILGNPLSLVH